MEIPTLARAGLTLRPLEVERDLAVMHRIFGDAASMKFMLEAPMASEEATRAKIAAWCEHQDSPQWAITGEDGETRGRITLIARRQGVMEIGVQVDPRAQGRGFARRAIAAVTEYGLGTRGLGRVFADIDPDNHGCVRAFEAAGFRLEGRLINSWVTHTGYADSLIYAATSGWACPAGL